MPLNLLPVIHKNVRLPQLVRCDPQVFDPAVFRLVPLEIIVVPFLDEDQQMECIRIYLVLVVTTEMEELWIITITVWTRTGSFEVIPLCKWKNIVRLRFGNRVKAARCSPFNKHIETTFSANFASVGSFADALRGFKLHAGVSKVGKFGASSIGFHGNPIFDRVALIRKLELNRPFSNKQQASRVVWQHAREGRFSILILTVSCLVYNFYRNVSVYRNQRCLVSVDRENEINRKTWPRSSKNHEGFGLLSDRKGRGGGGGVDTTWWQNTVEKRKDCAPEESNDWVKLNLNERKGLNKPRICQSGKKRKGKETKKTVPITELIDKLIS